MPWNESSPMDLRVKFVAEYLEGHHSLSSLCAAFEISRKTGYKWLNRYEIYGAEGLADFSTAPINSPQKLTEQMKQVLIEARQKHPTWGPKKIVAWLETKQPALKFPAPSTVGDLYKNSGLIPVKDHSRLRSKNLAPIYESKAANAVWCTDYKGEFRLGNGKICYPLTITDHFTRFLLCCQGHDRNDLLQTKNAFERVFKEFGIPEIILSDNGTPFSSPSGLSQLNIWWIKLGIKPLRIQPGKPQQNGRHERMHRTLKQNTAYPPQKNMESQQTVFNHFVHEYNFERPHASLNNQTPSVLYTPSLKPMPKEFLEFKYPNFMETKVAGPRGEIRWKGRKYFVSRALEGEEIAFEEKDDGLWLIHFGPIQVGYINRNARRIERSTKTAIKVSPMSPV